LQEFHPDQRISSVPALLKPWQKSPQAAALYYASLKLPGIPAGANKKPIGCLVPHGLHDATTHIEQIKKWWTAAPYAEFAFVVIRDIIVLDLDGIEGRRDFERLAGLPLEEFPGPIATTPRGGLHLFCAAGGRGYINTVRLADAAIDVRGYGTYVLLPGAGNGRFWVEGKPSKPAPILPAIIGLMTPRTTIKPMIALPPATTTLMGSSNGYASRYGKVSLELACQEIRNAPNGAQEITLNNAALRIGRLIRDRELPAVVVDQVLAAGLAMPSYDARRPWLAREIEAKVARAIAHGRNAP
jgi:hypothetical protein